MGCLVQAVLARVHLKRYKYVEVGKVKAPMWDAVIDMNTDSGKKLAKARRKMFYYTLRVLQN